MSQETLNQRKRRRQDEQEANCFRNASSSSATLRTLSRVNPRRLRLQAFEKRVRRRQEHHSPQPTFKTILPLHLLLLLLLLLISISTITIIIIVIIILIIILLLILLILIILFILILILLLIIIVIIIIKLRCCHYNWPHHGHAYRR